MGRATAVGGSEAASGYGVRTDACLCLGKEEAGEAAFLPWLRQRGDPDTIETRGREKVVDVPAEALSLPAGMPGEPGAETPRGTPRVGVVAGGEVERVQRSRANPGRPRKVKDEMVHPRLGKRRLLGRGRE